MPFPVLGSNSAVAEFAIDNSVRFNDDDSPILEKTFDSAGNQKTNTFSCWFKLSTLGTLRYIFSNTGNDSIHFDTNDNLFIELSGASNGYLFFTNQKWRDVSAWYHLVFVLDTTNATASNRMKLYLNGEDITSTAADSSNPSLNLDTNFSKNIKHGIGYRSANNDRYFDGYISEVYFIDGSALAPTEFGETNDNGVWIPKRFSGSYGTNGFFLEFQDSGNLGDDTSGNGNDFTATNLTATDQTTDTPTNNFCTMNSLASESGITFSEGNLKITSSTDGAGCGSTMAVKNGKWYFEVKYSDNANYGIGLGRTTEYTSSVGYTSTSYNIDEGGNKTHNSSFSNIFTLSGSNIIGFALDCDNQKIHFSQNGNWYNNNNSSTTLDPNNPDYSSVNVDEEMFAIYSHFATSSATVEFNFGNPTFTISSGNTDGNGYGNFEYAVPSGYYSLCTKNLAEYG